MMRDGHILGPHHLTWLNDAGRDVCVVHRGIVQSASVSGASEVSSWPMERNREPGLNVLEMVEPSQE